MPAVSVIIPTRGRDACLRQTLVDLGRQNFTDFDVWVVDQNDAPLTGLGAPLGKIPIHHEKMPPLGSHAGRNRAIFKTQAPICVFVDDDVRLDGGFVGAHQQALAALDTNVAAVAGRVIQPKDGLSEREMQTRGRPARYNRILGTVSGNFFGTRGAFVDHIHECNFSARTSALREIGGFSEEFKGNAYFEGADLALKLIERGYRALYRPEIALTHLQDGAGGNRVAEKARHTYWLMRNQGLLNSLHMNPLGIPAFAAYGLAYVLGKALVNRDPSIAREGLRGLRDGLAYFIKKFLFWRKGGREL